MYQQVFYSGNPREGLEDTVKTLDSGPVKKYSINADNSTVNPSRKTLAIIVPQARFLVDLQKGAWIMKTRELGDITLLICNPLADGETLQSTKSSICKKTPSSIRFKYVPISHHESVTEILPKISTFIKRWQNEIASTYDTIAHDLEEIVKRQPQLLVSSKP